MCSALLSLRGLWIRALRCRGRPLSTNFCQGTLLRRPRLEVDISDPGGDGALPDPQLLSDVVQRPALGSQVPRAVLLAHLPLVAHGDLRSIPKRESSALSFAECDTATRGKKGSMSTKVGLIVGFAAGYYLEARRPDVSGTSS